MKDEGQLSLFPAGAPGSGRGTARDGASGDVVETAVPVVWSGILMAPLLVSGRQVRPVVEVLPAGDDRIREGVAAESDRSVLALWESWPAELPGPPPARPLRVVGFVAEGRWRTAVTTAAQLCGFGASLLVRRALPARLRLAEADYHGITVAVVDPAGTPSVVVNGRAGPVPGAERTVAVRHLEERLFEHLLTRGRTAAGGHCGRSG